MHSGKYSEPAQTRPDPPFLLPAVPALRSTRRHLERDGAVRVHLGLETAHLLRNEPGGSDLHGLDGVGKAVKAARTRPEPRLLGRHGPHFVRRS